MILGNGDGSFQSARGYNAGSAPYQIEVADLNHDGNDDVVALNTYTSTAMSVVMENGDGSFQPYTTYNLGAFPNDVESGDFNADGNVDLIEPVGSGYQVELGRGDGSFYAPTVYAAPTGNTTVVDDFNGDGSADAVTANPMGTVTVLVNAADGTVGLAGTVGFQVSSPAAVIAGAPFTVTVTALDASGSPAAGFTGTVAISAGSGLEQRPAAVVHVHAGRRWHPHVHERRSPHHGRDADGDGDDPVRPGGADSVDVTPATASRFAVTALTAEPGGGPADVHRPGRGRLRQHGDRVRQDGRVRELGPTGRPAGRLHVYRGRRRRPEPSPPP